MILDISLDMSPHKKDSTYTHTVKLAREIRDKGIELFLVYSGEEKGVKIEGIPTANLPLMTFDASKFGAPKTLYNNIYTLIWLFFNMKRSPVQLIYERNNPIYLAGLVYAGARGIPLIYEVNGVLDEENVFKHNIGEPFKKILKIAFELQLNSASAIVVQTEELRDALAERFDRQKIFVVDNGAELTPMVEKKETGKVSLVYVGILDKMHDLSELFRAVSKVEVDFDFYVIGGGSDLEKYRVQYSNDERFVFLGKLDHGKVIRIIEEKDCICLASYGSTNPVFLKYGFYYCPIKFIEYSMVGNPTIVNKVSNSFINRFKEKNACFVASTEEDLITSLTELLNNRDKRRTMGRAAREIARGITWEKAAEETFNIFRRIVPIEGKEKSNTISVVIPAYNSSGTLARCLDSLQNQTCKPYEVIVVDSSKDKKTAKLVENYPFVKLVHSSRRLYPAAARNEGAKHVEGDVIAFIDSDCIADTEWLAKINKTIDNGVSGVGGSIGNCYDDRIIARAEYFLEFSEFNEYKKRQYVEKITSCNCSYTWEAFTKSGGFPDVRASEDDLFNLSLSCKGFRISFDPEIKVRHMNRTKLIPFLKNQVVLGEGFYESRKINKRLNGGTLVKYPVLFIAFPFARFIYRIKHAVNARRVVEFIAVSPIIFLGTLAFTYGCLKESRSS